MEYKYKWYIPDAYLHSRGTGYFTSHEGCAFINETGRDAHVRFTFYFQEPNVNSKTRISLKNFL